MVFALSMPLSLDLCFCENIRPPPQAASICNQSRYFLQMFAISSIGSNAPRTVVPIMKKKKLKKFRSSCGNILKRSIGFTRSKYTFHYK